MPGDMTPEQPRATPPDVMHPGATHPSATQPPTTKRRGAVEIPPGLNELDRKYELLYELGRGGMASVYYARERATGGERAIKVIHAKYLGNVEALARFAREARFVAQLAHPNIVAIHAVESVGGTALALVMDCIPGRTVKQLLRDNGAMPFDQVTRVLEDIAGALDYAHAHGIVHRDVKPENIFIDETTGRALLSDFGIARSMHSETSLTMVGMAIGTPTYMSPEQIDGAVDGRSDLYSLGLVGWEMLTGQRPWDGENLYKVIYRQKHDTLAPIDAIRPETPLPLLAAVERLLDKDPAARWQTAAEFRAQLSAKTPVRVRRFESVIAPVPATVAPERTMLFRREPSAWARAAGRRIHQRLGHRAGAIAAVAALLVSASLVFARPQPARLSQAIGRAVLRTHERTGTMRATALAASDRTADLPTAAPFTTLTPGGAAALPVTGRFTVAPGGMHTCLVSPSGAGYCWGDNGQGQIGDGGTSHAATPVSVAARVRFLAMAPGLSHTCAIARDGGGYCWGNNDHGQLGDGTTVSHDTPIPVLGHHVLRAIATGIAHSCALTRAGAVYCWGDDTHGELGDGGTADHDAPVAVLAPERFVSIVAGWNHTCALGASGTTYCWGANESGALGDGSTLDRQRPTPVRTTARFVLLSGGSAHTCGVTAEGVAYCWGENRYGQLGDGTMAAQLTPVRVALPEPVVTIAAGAVHTCALTVSRRAWCWGRNNYGQLGDGTLDDRAVPRQVTGGHAFATIATFGAHTCGTTSANEIFCWGDNLEGQLGDGTREHRLRPVYVEKPTV